MEKIISADIISQMHRKLTVFAFDEIDSTNNEAKRMLAAGNGTVPFLVAAGLQTAGRGRQGKSFYSPPDTGVYMSLAVQPQSVNDFAYLTSAAAVAVSDGIDAPANVKSQIKWVNDIYIGNRKVCGILAESTFGSDTQRYAVIGVGINITTDGFPAEIAETAGSLGVSISRNTLIAAVCDSLLNMFDNLQDSEFIERYRKKSAVLGKNIKYLENGTWHAAAALDIDSSGGLIVKHPDGTKTTLRSGEISVKF